MLICIYFYSMYTYIYIQSAFIIQPSLEHLSRLIKMSWPSKETTKWGWQCLPISPRSFSCGGLHTCIRNKPFCWSHWIFRPLCYSVLAYILPDIVAGKLTWPSGDCRIQGYNKQCFSKLKKCDYFTLPTYLFDLCFSAIFFSFLSRNALSFFLQKRREQS